MTVTVAPRYKRFNGNDTTGPFSFTFPILLSNSGTPYITVKRISSSGEETTLAYPTDYTFSALLLGKGGGIITTTVMVAAGEQLFVEATTPLDQQISFRNQGEFSAESHENGFDKVHFILLESVQKADLSIKFPSSEIGVGTTLPVAALRANTTLGFDGSGNILCGAVATTIVSHDMIPVVQAPTIAVARDELGLGTMATEMASDYETQADATAAYATFETSAHAAATYAPIASPTFTGTPSLPTGAVAVTQAAGNNSTKLATTAYADAAAAAVPNPVKAWVTWTAGGTTINGSLNVSSVRRAAAGDYTVNFTSALPSAEYAVIGSTATTSGISYLVNQHAGTAPTTTACRILITQSWTGSIADPGTNKISAAFLN